MRRLSIVRLTCAAGAILLLPNLSSAGTTTIATGPVSSLDGYLSIGPDEYGAWASVTFGGAGDLFNPFGGFGPLEATFSSGFFLFVPGSSQRELLSDNADWQGVYPADGSLSRTVTSALLVSDSSGNGVDDTLQSSFTVSGGGTDLGFDLLQHVGSASQCVAFLRQDYTITNLSGSTITFSMVRSYDGDLPWTGGANFFSDDEVGTSMHGLRLGPYVFQQEASDPGITAVTLSSPQGNNYYGGKHGIDPDGGGVPFDFGTDLELWDAYGIPDGSGGDDGSDWRNNIANVGYDSNGISGPFPPGSTDPEDGFIGLDFLAELGPGESTTFTVFHTYGRNSPLPAILGDLNNDGAVGITDLLLLIDAWGPCTDPCDCPADLDGNGTVGISDLLILLDNWG